MLLKSRGIVLRSIKYSETSLIVEMFTEHKGVRTFIMSGVRSATSKISAGLLQVTALVEFIAYFKEDQDINRIKEIKAAHVYRSTPIDIKKMSVALFMAEICQKSIRSREENSELFEFLYLAFCFVDSSENSVANVPVIFLGELSSYLGFMPNGTFNTSTPFFDLQEGVFQPVRPHHPYYLEPSDSEILSQILATPLVLAHELHLNSAQRKKALADLLEYFTLHIANLPVIHSHIILQEVLET